MHIMGETLHKHATCWPVNRVHRCLTRRFVFVGLGRGFGDEGWRAKHRLLALKLRLKVCRSCVVQQGVSEKHHAKEHLQVFPRIASTQAVMARRVLGCGVVVGTRFGRFLCRLQDVMLAQMSIDFTIVLNLVDARSFGPY